MVEYSRKIESDEPYGLTRYLILATLTFTTMLYTMTVMIANVALPKIQGTFACTQDQIALVVVERKSLRQRNNYSCSNVRLDSKAVILFLASSVIFEYSGVIK